MRGGHCIPATYAATQKPGVVSGDRQGLNWHFLWSPQVNSDEVLAEQNYPPWGNPVESLHILLRVPVPTLAEMPPFDPIEGCISD